MPNDTQRIVNAHDRYTSSVIAAFQQRLSGILATAQGRLMARLQKKLSFNADGTLKTTAANQRVLRSLDTLFADEMDAAGFSALAQAFASQFPQQIPYFDQIVDAINAQAKDALPSAREALSASDRTTLAGLQANAVDNLAGVVQAVGLAAKQRVLFGVGVLNFRDLADVLSEKFHIVLARAETIADTAITTWYRTLNDLNFRAMESNAPGVVYRYRYIGPDDEKTRLFCQRLVEADETYTREQISAMNNLQLPDVWITGGGFNCRHAWYLAFEATGMEKAA
jgi:hypothetical protein